jgi:Zn-dependent M28 family amino/carboxypeptidase
MKLILFLISLPVSWAQSDQERVATHITENSLKGHVAFLASDTLQGRATPSAGEEAAAEYIAAQFRRAGLEPAGDDAYFQTATFAELKRLPKLGALDRGRLDAASQHAGKIRNVAGLLRGSDPVLKDTYVILSAHYDHIGTTDASADQVNNGANDNASGTASVMEVASALADLPTRPKRSILFLAFFGEELGLLGSKYYIQHPLVPLQQTVAALNLEQLGRTDASNGDMTRAANLTGYDFSSLAQRLELAGTASGIRVFKDEKRSDPYFSGSDNLPFAEAGVVSHSLSVSYEFPDYHRAGDHWDKLDYSNMAATDVLVALGLLDLASDATPPSWNENVAGAKQYREASAKLHGEQR